MSSYPFVVSVFAELGPRTLLYLQLVMQMQKQIPPDDASSVLKKPEHILSFIKHALESPSQPERPASARRSDSDGLRMEDLRIVPDESDELDEGDSDDEEPDTGAEPTADDMVTTSVKLLLTVLEGTLVLFPTILSLTLTQSRS